MTSNLIRRSSGRRFSWLPATVVILALGLTTAACGGSDSGAKDDSGPSSGASSSSGETTSSDPSASSDAGGKVDLSKQKLLTPDYEVDEAIHAMLPQEVQDSGILKAALSTGNAPLTFPGATTSEVLGAVPDLQQAIAQILGVKVEGSVYPSTAEQLLAIQSNRADIAFSTNADTKEREASYDFVDYFKASYELIVQGGNVGKITTWQDLCGKNYGSVKGSIDIIDKLNEACEGEGLPDPKVSYFEDVPSMLLAENSGRIDTFFSPTTYAVWTNATDIDTASVKPPTEMTTMFGFTVGKEDTGVSAAVLAALQKLVDDGYYAKVLERWGMPEGAITPGINIGADATMFG